MAFLVYFPYIHLKNQEKITLNGVTIWNFDKLSEQYIPDENLRTHVSQLIKTNVLADEGNNQIEDIGVVSVGDTDFREFSVEEEALVNETKLILFLARIAKTNATALGVGRDGWSMATAENYQPVFQRFEEGNDHIAERTGYIINIGIGGYRLGEKKYYKPSHVLLSPFGCRHDSNLISNLLKLKKAGGKKKFRRILRATELVFQSYHNADNVSLNSRILLLAAAFETLLDLAEPARKSFKEAVEKYCDTQDEKKYIHYYQTRGGKKRDKNRSIKVLWADSFFELRNQIIHGDSVKTESFYFRNGDRQLDIAISFFVLLIKKILNEHVKDSVFFDEIEWVVRKNKTEGFQFEDHELATLLSMEYRKVSRRKTKNEST